MSDCDCVTAIASSVLKGGTAAEQAAEDLARDAAAGSKLLLAAALFDEGVSLPTATAEIRALFGSAVLT